MNEDIRAFVNGAIADGTVDETVEVLETALKLLQAEKATQAKKNNDRNVILKKLRESVEAIWNMGVENITPSDVAAFATLGAAADHPDWSAEELNVYFGAVRRGVESANRATKAAFTAPKQEKKVTKTRPEQHPTAPDVTVIHADSFEDAMRQLGSALRDVGGEVKKDVCTCGECAKEVAGKIKNKLPDSDGIEAIVRHFLDKLE